MAYCYLVVDVISADVPSSCNTSLNNYSVELRFNSQSFTTSNKENVRSPVWNETFRFQYDTTEQIDPSGDVTLEAYVYSVDQIRNSRSLLGKIQLSEASFCHNSADAVAMRYPWKSTGRVLRYPWQSTGRVLSRAKGALVLKVFLSDANELQHESWDCNPLTNLSEQFPPMTSAPWPSSSKADEVSLQPSDAVPKEINPCFEPGMVVEQMQFLFVRIVKACGLPDVDANGSLDPYVEVKFGDYKGVTEYLKRNKNPEWNTIFAFPLPSACPRVHVVVNDKDLVRDEFVGMLCFDLADILKRTPHDIPLEPMWYQLVDYSGKRSAQGSLMLAIWKGSQADWAYRHAWISDTVGAGISQLSGIRPKLYENPSLWCMRLSVIQAQGITIDDDEASIPKVFVRAFVGEQNLRTRPTKKVMVTSYVWNEELMFVVAEPFEGDLLKISVCTRGDPGDRDKVVGQIDIPLASLEKRAGNSFVKPRWFDLQKPASPQLEGAIINNDDDNNRMRIHLGSSLDGGYQVLYDPKYYMDDTRPADKQLWNPPIGLLELGILRASGLTTTNRRYGKSTLDPYCVAKYGGMWGRTRTVIASCNPVFNEQYKWDVYDTATVLTVGIFDNCQLEGKTTGVNRDTELGKIRVRISGLETGRIYAHSYPIFILSPSGVKRMGELQLAVRFSSASSLNMIRMYARPAQPEMHYTHPISPMQLDNLRLQAVRIVLSRLSRMEPALREEVLEHLSSMCSHIWSMRKSKANLLRIMEVISGLISFTRWFQDVRSWRNPAATLLVHAIFVLALLFHELILPSLLLSVVFMAVRNNRRRPCCPPHVDLRLFQEGITTPDEIDEEFDSFPTSQSSDVVRRRYDRLRRIGGRVQESVGNIASQGERILSLVSWRDPRATAIFEIFALMAALMLYFVPCKVLMAVAGFYIMRHPRLRRKTPSFVINFLHRVPSKEDILL